MDKIIHIYFLNESALPQTKGRHFGPTKVLFHSKKEDESRVGVVHELRACVVAIFFFFFFFFVVVVVEADARGGPKIRSIRLPPKFHQSEEAKCDSENDRRARGVVLRDDAKEP